MTERVVDRDSIASPDDIAVGDLLRWSADDGSVWLGRVASVTPTADGSGVDLTFGV